MNPLAWVLVLGFAAVAEALFTPTLLKAVVGLPPEFCPSGAFAVGLALAHFVASGTLLALSLAVLRAPLGLTWPMIAGAAAGTILGAFIVSWIVNAWITWSWSWMLSFASVGRIWDAVQWSKACGAGLGALLGANMLRRRRTTGCS
jgi:hypothetical protein